MKSEFSAAHLTIPETVCPCGRIWWQWLERDGKGIFHYPEK